MSSEVQLIVSVAELMGYSWEKLPAQNNWAWIHPEGYSLYAPLWDNDDRCTEGRKLEQAHVLPRFATSLDAMRVAEASLNTDQFARYLYNELGAGGASSLQDVYMSEAHTRAEAFVRLFGGQHVLLKPDQCTCKEEYCPVCDGGLGICVICGAGEVELGQMTCREKRMAGLLERRHILWVK